MQQGHVSCGRQVYMFMQDDEDIPMTRKEKLAMWRARRLAAKAAEEEAAEAERQVQDLKGHSKNDNLCVQAIHDGVVKHIHAQASSGRVDLLCASPVDLHISVRLGGATGHPDGTDRNLTGSCDSRAAET